MAIMKPVRKKPAMRRRAPIRKDADVLEDADAYEKLRQLRGKERFSISLKELRRD